jgi:hypothetical protein
MQGSRSQEHLPEFDTFECLTCRSVITESTSGLAARRNRSSDETG